MPSLNKTNNLDLNFWDRFDIPKMADFNSDNQKIDDAFKSLDDLISAIKTVLDSDDVALDTLQEVVGYIKENREALELLGCDKVNITDIVNNLTTETAGKALDARQGKLLADMLADIAADNSGGGIPEAPDDDKLYGRKNLTWAEIEQGATISVNEISPADGNISLTAQNIPQTAIVLPEGTDQNINNALGLLSNGIAALQEQIDSGDSNEESGISEAPNDDKLYGRKNLSWTEIKQGTIVSVNEISSSDGNIALTAQNIPQTAIILPEGVSQNVNNALGSLSAFANDTHQYVDSLNKSIKQLKDDSDEIQRELNDLDASSIKQTAVKDANGEAISTNDALRLLNERIESIGGVADAILAITGGF